MSDGLYNNKEISSMHKQCQGLIKSIQQVTTTDDDININKA